MSSFSFFINQDACIGCRACAVACKDRNDLQVGYNYRSVKTYQTGKYPNASIYHYSAACNHCETPACITNCPTGAMQKDVGGDGTVQHDDEICIGCGNCTKSCPYQVPVLLQDKGIAGKCDACKPYRDAGLNPVCVDACVMRCLDFGDSDELKAKYGDDIVNTLPILPSPEETNPTTLIKPKKSALATDFKQVII
jgi:anaerobic dimethyl sulfoxide reductase subunit B (iron-sulfur subunit)